MSKGETNVKVVVRIRPESGANESASERIVVRAIDDQIVVFDPVDDDDDFVLAASRPTSRTELHKRGVKKTHRDTRFAFDRVFDENATQDDVYEATTRGIVDRVLDGINCSVFAYGATGAGKTHTMLGSQSDPGVVYRTMIELFETIEQRRDQAIFNVVVTYAEIYNERVRDLLRPSGDLPMRENPNKEVCITGLSYHKPKSADEVLGMLAQGNENRTQHPTDANAQSSRSHAVFQVLVQQKPRTSGLSSQMKTGKMSLIDLAGSERATVTTNRGARFREGANINRSLLALGNCINALAEQKKGGHVPYRDSKLTRLLKDSLGGTCYTVMIANVRPLFSSYEDSYNTLKYADRAKRIRSTLVSNFVNVDIHVTKYKSIVESLQNEVAQLKQKLLNHSVSDEAMSSRLPLTTTYSFPSSQLTRFHELENMYAKIQTVRLDLVDVEFARKETEAKKHEREQTIERLCYWMPETEETESMLSLDERLESLASRRDELERTLAVLRRDVEEKASILGCSGVESSSFAVEFNRRLTAGVESEVAAKRNVHWERFAEKQRKESENNQRFICQLLTDFRPLPASASASEITSTIARRIRGKGKGVAFSLRPTVKLATPPRQSQSTTQPRAIAVAPGILTRSRRRNLPPDETDGNSKAIDQSPAALPRLPPPPSGRRTPRRFMKENRDRLATPTSSSSSGISSASFDVNALFRPLVEPDMNGSARKRSRMAASASVPLSPFQPANRTVAKSPKANMPRRIPVKKKASGSTTTSVKRTAEVSVQSAAKRAVNASAQSSTPLSMSARKRWRSRLTPGTPSRSDWKRFLT